MGAGGLPPYPKNSIGAPTNLPYKFEEERGKRRREEEEEEESPLKLNPASVTDGLLHPIRVMTSLTGARRNDSSSRPMVTLTWVPRAPRSDNNARRPTNHAWAGGHRSAVTFSPNGCMPHAADCVPASCFSFHA